MQKSSRFKTLRRFSGAAALGALLWACQRHDGGAGVLRVVNGAEPSTLDLHLATGQPELRILGALFEGLLRRGEHPGEVKPGVAQHWKASADGLRYTFHLRPCRWSDGSPLTAGDFVYSWRRFVDPITASEYGSLLKIVRNGNPVRQSKMPVDSLGIHALDDSTVMVELEYPVSFFLDLCAFEPFAPVPRQAIERYGTQWTEPGNLIGNGPFELSKWERNASIEVKRSRSYWDVKRTGLSAVSFKAVEDQLTAFNMFLAGEADWLFSLPPSKIDAAKATPGFFTGQMYGTYYLLFNCANKGYNSPLLRKALAYAIDRKTLTERILKGLPKPATGFVPPTPDFPGAGMELYDPTKAREFLRASGYSARKPPEQLQILFNNSESNKTIAEVIQQMWKETLGLEAELVNFEWKVYLAQTKGKRYPSVARASWIGDFADPISFLELGVSDNGNNRSGYSNPRYDSLIARTWSVPDPVERKRVMAEAERLLMEDMPVAPIYFYALSELRTPRLRHATPNPLGMYDWKAITLE